MNLERCVLERNEDGQRIVVNGKHPQEGSDSFMPYHGFLVLANGPTILKELIDEKMINDVSDDRDGLDNLLRDYHGSRRLLSKGDFLEFLEREEIYGEDGAYVFNSRTGEVVRVSSLNNSSPTPEGFYLRSRVPDDFVHYGGSKGQMKLGTKTSVAIRVPVTIPNIETFQVKRSAYGKLGMGKITHFDHYGLVEEAFFETDRSGEIFCCYRKYKSENGKLYKTNDVIVGASDIPYFGRIISEIALEKAA